VRRFMTARYSSGESSTSDPGYIPFSKAAALNKRQHCGASGSARLQGTVILVVLKIAPAYQHHDIAACVIQADESRPANTRAWADLTWWRSPWPF